jgi:hypothetical protein
MTSDRPYRRALPESVARDEILRESGGQFDPEVVQAFLSIPWNIGPKFAEKLNGCWLQIHLRILSTPFIASSNPLPVELAERDGKWKDTGEDSLFARTRPNRGTRVLDKFILRQVTGQKLSKENTIL